MLKARFIIISLTVFCNLFVSNVALSVDAADAASLDIKFIKQENQVWCWLAVSQMALDFLIDEETKQCELINSLTRNHHGYPIDCCRTPNARMCLRTGSSQEVVRLAQNNGLPAKIIRAGLSYEEVKKAIENDIIIIAGVSRAQYGHVVIVNGYEAPNKLSIVDPMHGIYTRTYDELIKGDIKSSFVNSSGTRTHGYMMGAGAWGWGPMPGPRPRPMPRPGPGLLKPPGWSETILVSRTDIDGFVGTSPTSGGHGPVGGNCSMLNMAASMYQMSDGMMNMISRIPMMGGMIGGMARPMKDGMMVSALRDPNMRRQMLWCSKGNKKLLYIMLKEIMRNPRLLDMITDVMIHDDVFVKLFIEVARIHRELCDFFFAWINPRLYDVMTTDMVKFKGFAKDIAQLMYKNEKEKLGLNSPFIKIFTDLGSVENNNDGSEKANERYFYSVVRDIDAGLIFMDFMKNMSQEKRKMIMDFVFFGKLDTPNGSYEYKQQVFLNIYAMVEAMHDGMMAQFPKEADADNEENKNHPAKKLFQEFMSLMMEDGDLNLYGESFLQGLMVMAAKYRHPKAVPVLFFMMEVIDMGLGLKSNNLSTLSLIEPMLVSSDETENKDDFQDEFLENMKLAFQLDSMDTPEPREFRELQSGSERRIGVLWTLRQFMNRSRRY